MDYKDNIKKYLKDLSEAIERLDVNAINDAINLLEETRKNDGTIYIFGNGGSASTASHMLNDFNRGISQNLRKKYKFVCLSDTVSIITAIANDDSYDNIFLKQLENRLYSNDIVIALSGSGNSINVIKAVEYAKSKNNKIIAMTGYDGGKLSKLADINLHVDINNMQITEDIHLVFNHIMMYILCSIKE